MSVLSGAVPQQGSRFLVDHVMVFRLSPVGADRP